jgi:hypothetical protein
MTPDWPGDTAPLPHAVAEDRLGARLAGMVGGWRCDNLANGSLRTTASTWHATEADALAEADRLVRLGVERVVVWQGGP